VPCTKCSPALQVYCYEYYTAWCATRFKRSRGAGLGNVRHLQKLQHDQLLFRALAAVAVTGAAFAQSNVTISGKLRFAYESAEKKSTTPAFTGASSAASAITAAGKRQGLQVTDGDFRLTATEDLGGGLKATAYMEVQSRGRTTDVVGRDAGLSISGGFGTVFIGAIEAANGIEPLASAGAPGFGDLDANNFGYNVLRGAGNVDMLRYTSPEIMPGLNVYVSMLDANNRISGETNPAPGAGLGGMESTSRTQDIKQVGFTYNAGAIKLAGDYATWGKNAATTGSDKRTRISGNYNLGVATVGAGFETVTFIGNAKDKQQMVGVSIPLGAITLGATYAEGKVTGGQKRTGYDLGAKYDLSKRTYVGVHYLASKNKAATVAGTDTRMRVQLAHSF
jgi:predicted porin